jgi:hypothetical protein
MIAQYTALSLVSAKNTEKFTVALLLRRDIPRDH